MKTIVASLAALAALTAVATPAAAQPYGYDRYERPDRYERESRERWMPIGQRFERLDRRIDRGLQRGDLTPREAARLRSEFHQLARLENRYRYDGLNGWERADLDRRFDQLEARVRWERRDRDYGNGYGYGQRW